jgi:c-di-GMP-related signal transduction protein
MEKRLGYNDPKTILYLLLQRPEETNTLLEENKKLKKLGYTHVTGLRDFILTPNQEERKEFLFWQGFLGIQAHARNMILCLLCLISLQR